MNNAPTPFFKFEYLFEDYIAVGLYVLPCLDVLGNQLDEVKLCLRLDAARLQSRDAVSVDSKTHICSTSTLDSRSSRLLNKEVKHTC